MSDNKTPPDDSASHDGDALPQIDFVTFIMSLATSALIQLGEHEDGTGGGPVNLPLAKQTIDMIGAPFCTACTRRVEKELPSRISSTAKRIGRVSSPGRMK